MRLVLVHWSVEINFTFLTVNSTCIVLKNEENQALVTFIIIKNTCVTREFPCFTGISASAMSEAENGSVVSQ